MTANSKISQTDELPELTGYFAICRVTADHKGDRSIFSI